MLGATECERQMKHLQTITTKRVHYTRLFVSGHGSFKAKMQGCGARDRGSCCDGVAVLRGGKHETEGVDLGEEELCEDQGSSSVCVAGSGPRSMALKMTIKGFRLGGHEGCPERSI